MRGYIRDLTVSHNQFNVSSAKIEAPIIAFELSSYAFVKFIEEENIKGKISDLWNRSLGWNELKITRSDLVDDIRPVQPYLPNEDDPPF